MNAFRSCKSNAWITRFEVGEKKKQTHLILRVQQVDVLQRTVARAVPRTAEQIVLQVGNVLVVRRLVLPEDGLQLVELCTLVRGRLLALFDYLLKW